MDSIKAHPIIKKFNFSNNFYPLLGGILLLALVLGIGTGFFLSKSNSASSSLPISAPPKAAQQDAKTFRDFAEGKVAKKPAPKSGDNYTEGTHILVRDGAVPVALTSSVVDLSLYEGKSVKVYGETQKAVEEGWLMDVGRVEEK